MLLMLYLESLDKHPPLTQEESEVLMRIEGTRTLAIRDVDNRLKQYIHVVVDIKVVMNGKG